MPEQDKKKELLKLLEGDATDAGFRLAGKQFMKLTREPLVAFLAGHLGPDDPSMRAKVAAFLETELGEALICMMLSLGLSTLPDSVGEIPRRLSRELRIASMADVGDVVADLLMSPIRSLIASGLVGEPEKERSALPQESLSHPRVRVELTPVTTEQPVPAPQAKKG